MGKQIVRKGSNVSLMLHGKSVNAKVLNRYGKKYCTIKTKKYYNPIEDITISQTIGGVLVSNLITED